MAFTVYDTIRARAHAVLAAADQPVTSVDLAALLGTTAQQAARALRQLEAEGTATRTRAGLSQFGRIPDQWTTASPGPQSRR
ncbi:hypothetical protein [Streptomyces ureilyticus]|uniref:HTH marR-type domain-containing protein n=1 Tax=Streptomyces ureilyticus TaxID=1775131 RepID=A0ABX0DPI0_9ACTN|nr:hypothetical protein [Streptomyces ureilyticus]NGO43782.1 hypothetical protein [Streptomyces ureilyticus]